MAKNRQKPSHGGMINLDPYAHSPFSLSLTHPFLGKTRVFCAIFFHLFSPPAPTPMHKKAGFEPQLDTLFSDDYRVNVKLLFSFNLRAEKNRAGIDPQLDALWRPMHLFSTYLFSPYPKIPPMAQPTLWVRDIFFFVTV